MLTDESLTAAVAKIPAGCWTTYSEVLHAAGGEPWEALEINTRLRRLNLPGGHRILRVDGGIVPNGNPARVRRLLVAEGVMFTGTYADPARRWSFSYPDPGHKMPDADPMYILVQVNANGDVNAWRVRDGEGETTLGCRDHLTIEIDRSSMVCENQGGNPGAILDSIADAARALGPDEEV